MILVLNCGSQSIKYKLFGKEFKLVKEENLSVGNQKDFEKVLKKEFKSLERYKKDIIKVGHRVVHGGEKFRDPLVVGKNIKELEKYNKLAPLHNPFNVLGIKVSSKAFPGAKQVAVFDTGFYKSLSEKVYTYALKEEVRKKFGFRRYGFHGISHEYVAKEGAKKIGKPFNKLKIISCHLGGGASVTAIKNGKSIDTSMGFTPLEGLVMMTRTGDIDPGVLLELCGKYSVDEVKKIVNKESGMKGICGKSEMLDILKKNDRKCKLALDVFAYRIKKYIGAYFAVLGGCDLLVFTGSVGSGSKKIRDMICKDLHILKKTKVLAMQTNEELMIAKKI